jgi:phosphomannomutase
MLGGEESGGLSILGHIPEKDGILACLLAAEIIAHTGKSMAELKADLFNEFGPVETRRLDIGINEGDKEMLIEKLAHYTPKTVAGLKVDSVSRLEGSKIVLENGSWVLIRFSGTEPMVRAYFEANDQETLEAIREEVYHNIGL